LRQTLLGGDHTLTVSLRPIVRQRPESGESEAALAAVENIREYTTRVHVSVPWNKRAEEMMTQRSGRRAGLSRNVRSYRSRFAAVSAWRRCPLAESLAEWINCRRSRQRERPLSGAFLLADDGIRTHDLLHGKQML
jgi:hypothetical protein